MFVDVKRSTQYLKEQQELFMFSEQTEAEKMALE